MNKTIILSSPHMHQAQSVRQIMRQVIYALVPGIVLSIWFFGWGVLFQCLLAIIFALMVEALILYLRNRPLKVFLYDGSALVTALLFSLAISPFTPFWINCLGICFAIVIAKHCFGGLGHNIFNPAMAGYVFVLLCFPAELTTWPYVSHAGYQQTGLAETWSIIFLGHSAVPTFDSLSGATLLGHIQSQLSGMAMLSEIRTSPLFGSFAGRGSEWIALAWLAGGLWLLFTGIIQWRLPVTYLATLAGISLLFYWFDNNIYLSPLFVLFSGGTMLATFFIVTDPVTASTTPRGRIIYAGGIALLTYLIRTFGGYPDGVAFAVLIMNAAVPLIDSYTRPRVFGEK